MEKGETLSEYISAGPPPDSGLHRYVFLLFEQSGKHDFAEPKLTNRSPANRAKFSVRDFVKKHDLGAPVAGNLFEAEYDEYVLVLYKKLSNEY